MSILIKTVRIAGFRGLENLEVELEQTTVLTGMNNTGKTSFLKALQIALGNRQFISQDDFFIKDNCPTNDIIIDLLIVPVNDAGHEIKEFIDNWEILLTTDRIQNDGDRSFLPLRTTVTFDVINNSYKTQKTILRGWPKFKENSIDWFDENKGKTTNFSFSALPFFYMDAQRDILEDTKLRSSYLGKMLSNIEYSEEDITAIEEQIEVLNEKAVSSSDILSKIKETLKGLDSALDSQNGGIQVTPFTKKIRDFNKGLTIYYGDSEDSFPMEYHGMGTRSWSSLLTLKSFISLLASNAQKKETVFFPVLAIEEPEAHLHPNAQKKLYSQINSIVGQKIISTHSPYIAAVAELGQIRNFYKDQKVHCGRIAIAELNDEEQRKIKRQVVSSRGEIFFSKLMVFFEGETEEQALPIFAKYHFRHSAVEMGIDFVGVGGYGNYLPFLRFAESLNIPWVILSDGEDRAIKSIKKTLKKLNSIDAVDLSEQKNVFVLDNGADFEKHLIDSNYIEEIQKAFISLYDENYLRDKIQERDGTKEKRIKTADICSSCNQSIYTDLLRNYTGDEGFKRALYDIMTSQKTKFAPVIAEQIVKSDKGLPPKILELFSKIASTLNITEETT